MHESMWPKFYCQVVRFDDSNKTFVPIPRLRLCSTVYLFLLQDFIAAVQIQQPQFKAKKWLNCPCYSHEEGRTECQHYILWTDVKYGVTCLASHAWRHLFGVTCLASPVVSKQKLETKSALFKSMDQTDYHIIFLQTVTRIKVDLNNLHAVGRGEGPWALAAQ